MDSVAIFFESEESVDMDLRLVRRHLRDTSNPLELPHTEFVKCFRLNKKAFEYVLGVVNINHKEVIRSTSVPTILKLAAVLQFLANGSYQHGIGESYQLGLSQPATSNALRDMLNILENNICPKWIRFPMSDDEKHENKRMFYEKCGIPGVIGSIDGTHIRIIAPSKEEQHIYYNRKGFYSINAMIVCDHKMFIRYVDAKYPGSSHDSHVWNLSDLRKHLQESYSSGERDCWLLGDSGYPLQPYLMTPFRDAIQGSVECFFNTRHAKGRNIVERTIGLLKNRYRSLLGARQLHYSPVRVTQIINVCCALHNISLHYNPELEATADFIHREPDYDELNENNNTNDSLYSAAVEIRRRIAYSL